MISLKLIFVRVYRLVPHRECRGFIFSPGSKCEQWARAFSVPQNCGCVHWKVEEFLASFGSKNSNFHSRFSLGGYSTHSQLKYWVTLNLYFHRLNSVSELSLGGKVQFLHSLQNKMCTMTPKDFRALHLLDLTLMNKTRRVFEYDYIGSIFVRNLFLLSSCFSIQMHSQKIEVILIPRSNF